MAPLALLFSMSWHVFWISATFELNIFPVYSLQVCVCVSVGMCVFAGNLLAFLATSLF